MHSISGELTNIWNLLGALQSWAHTLLKRDEMNSVKIQQALAIEKKG